MLRTQLSSNVHQVPRQRIRGTTPSHTPTSRRHRDKINSVIITLHYLACYKDGFGVTSNSNICMTTMLKFSHPEVLGFEPWDTVVRCTDLCQEIEEGVQIIQSLDALVQRGHHCFRMFCQLHAVRLFFARVQFTELLEQIEKFMVLLEQPGTKEVSYERNFSLTWCKMGYWSETSYRPVLEATVTNSRPMWQLWAIAVTVRPLNCWFRGLESR